MDNRGSSSVEPEGPHQERRNPASDIPAHAKGTPRVLAGSLQRMGKAHPSARSWRRVGCARRLTGPGCGLRRGPGKIPALLARRAVDGDGTVAATGRIHSEDAHGLVILVAVWLPATRLADDLALSLRGSYLAGVSAGDRWWDASRRLPTAARETFRCWDGRFALSRGWTYRPLLRKRGRTMEELCRSGHRGIAESRLRGGGLGTFCSLTVKPPASSPSELSVRGRRGCSVVPSIPFRPPSLTRPCRVAGPPWRATQRVGGPCRRRRRSSSRWRPRIH
jgi:hypothetical protein